MTETVIQTSILHDITHFGVTINVKIARQCNPTRFMKNSHNRIMGKSVIYAGIAVGVVAIAGIMVYGTANQANYIPDDATPAKATLEGAFANEGLSPVLNKEQWHEDPFEELSAKIQAKAGA